MIIVHHLFLATKLVRAILLIHEMIKEQFIEIFRYRVVYPGGTFIRVSPSVDSEKTGKSSLISFEVDFASI